jgi:hypothetical protein
LMNSLVNVRALAFGEKKFFFFFQNFALSKKK